jgi:hypothetical protein
MFKFLHAADIHLDSPLRGIARYEGMPVEGVVATEGDRNQAGIYVNTVSGVFSVTNNLRMEGDQK